MSAWLLLEGDPAPGDPSAVRALARQFGRAAEEFHGGRRRLTRMMAGNAMPGWLGPASAAFVGGLEPLRDDLRSAADSFDVAAAALSSYARLLDSLQTQARNLLAQANRAQQRIDAANLSLARASSSVEQTIASQGLDPLAAMTYRRQTLAPYQQAVSDAEAWLRAVRSQAQELRREHEAAARRAADGFGRATKVGIHETFRDRALSVLTQVGIYADVLKPAATVVGLAALAIAVVAFSGGAAAPAVVAAFSAKFGVAAKVVALAAKASAAVNTADVSARIARRGLGDETMTDSDAKLLVDAALAVASWVVPKVTGSAADKGKLAIESVRATGYHAGNYQAVNAAHQAMNQAILLKGTYTMVSVYDHVFVKVPQSIELLTGGSAPRSVYAPPVPPVTPPATTTPVLSGTPTIAAQTSADALLPPSVASPTLQTSLAGSSLQGSEGSVPGLQPVGPTVRSYQLPIDVRK